MTATSIDTTRSGSRRRRGLWREAPIVMPSALLLFALLGLATLLSYRAAVDRFAAEREQEALALAVRAAELAASEGERAPERLLRALPVGAGIAVLDASGGRLWSEGFSDGGMTTPPAVAARIAEAERTGPQPVVLGPERTGMSSIVALVPFVTRERARLLRLDLPARALAEQRRTLALLTPFFFGLAIAAVFVVALFFRALMRPYELLLERARAAATGGIGGAGGENDAAERDDLDFLVGTFDRALAALGAPAGDLGPLAGTLGRSLDGGFLLLDAEGRLLVATPAAAELLGPATPAPGVRLDTALAPTVERSEELERAIASGSPLPRATLRRRSGDAERSLALTVEPLKGESAKLRGFLVVVADVSEHDRAEARQRLAEGLAQLGELSAGVAHELRNGLAALRGWVQLLRKRPLEGEAHDLATEIERETRQLARVVDEFLAFARPGTRRAEPVDLAALARRAAADPALEGHPVELRVDLGEGGEATVSGDPMLLERALRNLLANAVQAARQEAGERGSAPAPVELELASTGDRLRLTVADRGPGIPAAVRERLFEPFASARAGGLGLGLALARRIALLHGGTVELADRPGGGTVASLTLPTNLLPKDP